jgi:hypothetical protein
LQEDGLEVLRGSLFGSVPVTTKNAAAYGLRKMRGRMKKMALDILKQGLKHRDNSTREVCRHALRLLGEEVPAPSNPQRKMGRSTRIKDIPRKFRPRGPVGTRRSR